MIWNVEREIVTFGALALRWYSLLFALGFVIGYFVVQRVFRAERKPEELLDSLLFHLVIGTVVGARLGHTLLYEPMEYLTDPIRILKIWEGGLASHGGFTGVIIAMILFCRKHPETPFFWLMDRLTFPCMIAAGCIRIGNFFNSEILGLPANVPWAVIFQKVDMVPRHPTQIYEAIGYFVVAAITYGVYLGSQRKPLEGRLLGLTFILAYGFRAVIEIFKENQVPFENTLPLNMGQLLSLPFIAIGFFFFFGLHRNFALFRRGMSADQLDGYDDDGGAPMEQAAAGAGGASRRGQLRKQSRKLKG